MPLSEEELRLLEQMERALVAEDPKLASTMRGTKVRKQARRHMALGIVGFVAGVCLLMSGAVFQQIPLGVVGFVMMLGTAYLVAAAWRGQTASAPMTGTPDATSAERALRVVQGGKAGPKRPRRQGSTMMERFEERWKRRRGEGGF